MFRNSWGLLNSHITPTIINVAQARGHIERKEGNVMVDYKVAAENILECVGGKENVIQVSHCATRLRLALRSTDQVQTAELKDLALVKGAIESGGQYQIILGTGIVNKVYKEFVALTGEGGGDAQVDAKGGNQIQRLSRMFGDIFLPVIPVIVASGILMGVRSFLTGTGVLATDSAWYTVMAILIDTGFSFLPALICYSAAKKFGGSPILGFVLGLMVISGSLPAAGAVGRGNAEPLLITLLGIPFRLTGFQGSVLVAIVGGWLIAKVEGLCRRFVPNVFDIILTPILTLAISLSVILFGVGPVIHIIEGGVVNLFQMLIQLPLGIGGFIIGGLQQILVIAGIHHGLWVIDINFIETLGTNPYMPIRTAAVVGQAGVVTAFFVFAKDKKLKALGGSSSIAAWFGITEPAIFGITLPYGVPFILGCIGSAFGGMFSALINLSAAGMGVSAIPGYLLFLNGGVLQYTLVCLIAAGISFVLTAVYIRKKEL